MSTQFPCRFGKYLLLERISTGGMAEVFRAKSFGVAGFEKSFALKRILPHISEDPEFIAMFIDEAKIASKLHHANICQIVEFGRTGDYYFQVMEYVPGCDLRKIRRTFQERGGVVPPEVCLLAVEKVCDGLDYAHRKTDVQGQPMGIVHRDVSPQNLLISFEGAVKLIDFGIAKAATRAAKTQAGQIKGKFSYLSPEQITGQPLDGRVDIFALGIVLWEMLTGHDLFVADSEMEILRMILRANIPPPSQVNPALPPALDGLVLQALALNPDDRYQCAEDFLEEIQRVSYKLNLRLSSTGLQRFMATEFAQELDLEQRKVRHFWDLSRETILPEQEFGYPEDPGPANGAAYPGEASPGPSQYTPAGGRGGGIAYHPGSAPPVAPAGGGGAGIVYHPGSAPPAAPSMEEPDPSMVADDGLASEDEYLDDDEIMELSDDDLEELTDEDEEEPYDPAFHGADVQDYHDDPGQDYYDDEQQPQGEKYHWHDGRTEGEGYDYSQESDYPQESDDPQESDYPQESDGYPYSAEPSEDEEYGWGDPQDYEHAEPGQERDPDWQEHEASDQWETDDASAWGEEETVASANADDGLEDSDFMELDALDLDEQSGGKLSDFAAGHEASVKTVSGFGQDDEDDEWEEGTVATGPKEEAYEEQDEEPDEGATVFDGDIGPLSPILTSPETQPGPSIPEPGQFTATDDAEEEGDEGDTAYDSNIGPLTPITDDVSSGQEDGEDWVITFNTPSAPSGEDDG